MMTNPNTLGIFETHVREIAAIDRTKGGLVYNDGANFNAPSPRPGPGDMGLDVMHFNLHKTFATPHGGGGPGSGPVCVAASIWSQVPAGAARCDQSPAPAIRAWPTTNPLSIGRAAWPSAGDTAEASSRPTATSGAMGAAGLKRASQLGGVSTPTTSRSA